MIGDDVEITVVDIRGDKVRLGINAPRHIQVHRKEVYEAIKRENQQAANLTPGDVAPALDGGTAPVNGTPDSTDDSDQRRSKQARRSQG
jgi:carbon storage regulator